MAFNIPNGAFRLSAEEAGGGPDYAKALSRGFQTAADVYKPQTMAEELLKKQILNKFLPRSEEARIANTEAGTGLIGQQSKYYGPNIESEISLRNAQKGLYGAQAQKESQIAALKKRMMEAYFPEQNSSGSMQAPSENSSTDQSQHENYSSGMGMPLYAENIQNSFSKKPVSIEPEDHFNQINQMQQANQNSPYGIPSLKPSREDLASKMLFGIDTFGEKQKQNTEQVNKERTSYTKKAEAIDSEVEASNKQRQLLDRYNKLMDETLLSGPIGSKAHLPTANRQKIEAISRDMILSGIEELKSAMGSAKFSNLDLETATARKPDITWSPEARREYTERYKEFNKRLNERAAFNQVASNPNTGVSSKDADRLWSAYQKHHPIIADSNTLQINKYKPHNWASYLTPEAINSIKKTGDYNPKDKGLIHNLSKSEHTLAEKYSLSELEKKLAEKRRSKTK